MRGHTADLAVVADVMASLSGASETLATAESCTGGLLSTLLTELPGSSDVFLGGVVAYSNDAKSTLLGVHHDTITAHGAVSKEVACAMAEGARKALGADYAVALTGIAGPGGGTREKPVGTVWCAIAGADLTKAFLFNLKGTRATIRDESAKLALLELMEFIKGD